MRRKIYSFLLLICLLLSCTGCQDTKETEKSNVSSQQDDTQKEKKSEVRSSFTTKQSETEEAIEEKEQGTELTEETETESTQEEPGAIAASEDTYDYVALGNSITCNEIEEGLWWGNWGMAASSEEKDYVHLVSNWLGGQSARPVTTTVLDLKKWEVAQKRDDILADYETYFNEHTDLVTIQTGENITDYRDTLTMDYLNLVDFVKKKAPNALILMLGETLWPSEDIESAKQAACDYYGVIFVDMKKFLNGYADSYKSALGTEVSGADGGTYTIGNEVVAAHPNDEGMACIAQQVIDHITVNN